jgi:coenzyme F420 hydrogenase subunit beta
VDGSFNKNLLKLLMVEIMDIQNIQIVVDKEICTGCGTCFSMCPKKAIDICLNQKEGIFLPSIDKEKCNYCGICLTVCPRHNFDFDLLNMEIFEKNPENDLIGFYSKCYIGSSKNQYIRVNSSSGGVITQILISALERRIIDAAIVVKMDENNPLEPKPFVARTKEQIIESAQSKYCPVPLNILLKYAVESNERIAIVGLPCHINGIRTAQKFNKKLKENIVFCFALFCNHTPNMNATTLLLDRYNIKKENLTSFSYRSNGWPGSMTIKTEKQTLNIPQGIHWKFIGSYFFYPNHCIVCNDTLGELADASFGDAWLPEYVNDKKGTSIIVIRNEKLIQMITDMKSDLDLKEVDASTVIKSQSTLLYIKKKVLSSYDSSRRVHLRSYTELALAKYIKLNKYFASTNIGIKLLVKLPLKIIWVLNLPLNITLSKLSKKRI